MKIHANKEFNFNNNKYIAIRLYRENYKYQVKKFKRTWNGWVSVFRANTLSESN
jgi:hypothetical protein